ncbi:MAG: hypothetical protein A2503_10070 [Burkholderiales bacterium RIFOXYD12_FULL_59_19]|nr:MAG: hypothetical protein A2503_10070 [Burkholderiales bacterium RIFOXYD12_FULL_59_19]
MNVAIFFVFMCVVVGVAMGVYRFDQKRQEHRQMLRRQVMGRRAPSALTADATQNNGVELGNKFEESEYSRLNKQATAYKKAGDMASAVAVLQQAKALCGSEYADTRLAKFLQAAGLFDEAMLEIQWLLDHSQSWAQALFGHQPASVIECQLAGWRSRVHADAALICKRAKRADLQTKHEQLQRHQADINLQLRAISEIDRKAKFIAWEAAKAKGADAMTNYLKKR